MPEAEDLAAGADSSTAVIGVAEGPAAWTDTPVADIGEDPVSHGDAAEHGQPSDATSEPTTGVLATPAEDDVRGAGNGFAAGPMVDFEAAAARAIEDAAAAVEAEEAGLAPLAVVGGRLSADGL